MVVYREADTTSPMARREVMCEGGHICGAIFVPGKALVGHEKHIYRCILCENFIKFKFKLTMLLAMILNL